MKRAILILVILFRSLGLNAAEASKLKLFLTSCAYGTAGGALLGVASIAIANDPAASFSNVAKGASLGLYAGIGIGLYLINDSSEVKSDISHYFFTPKMNAGKAEGLQLNYLATTF